MTRHRLLALILCLILPGCGVIRSGVAAVTPEKEEEPNPFGPTGVPPHLRARGGPSATGGAATTRVTVADLTPPDQIIFTNPDDPDSSLAELSSILVAPSRGPWETDANVARKRAAREGKPLLIWFTDSARSPLCKVLSAELFSTPDFEEWASPRLVRLRVDANYNVTEPGLTMDERDHRVTEQRNAVTELKKRYNILGHPSVIMLRPDGEVAGRYRGFKRGEADYFWGLIKQGEVVASTAHAAWRADMEKKGYREWSDRRGRKIFARLVSYREGRLILVEPDGTRARTTESTLSDQDQSWIREQKRLRGMQ
jgi:thioredoxin-related protein